MSAKFTCINRCIILIILILPLRAWSQDTVVPESPDLLYISVEPFTGDVYIEWNQSPSEDVAAYIIYIDKSASWIAIDTIWDPSATSYINYSSNADYYSESYVIAAFDSARNVSPLTDPHTTMFVSAEFDTCLTQISLDWTPYSGWDADLESYEIISSINGDPDTTLQIPDPDQTDYLHTDIEAYAEYCYYIRANHVDGFSSTSNRICTFTQMPRPPSYINADYATVEEENKIHLSFTIDPETEIHRYILFRGDSPSAISESITSFENPVSWKIEYSDIIGDLTQRYYYQLAAVNACDTAVIKSNIASNMVLSTQNMETINYLTWTSYYSWDGGVDTYNIYRLTGDAPPQRIVSLPGTDTIFSDDITALQYTAPGGKFCYFIEADEGFSNPLGVRGIALSNRSCCQVPAKVFIPNAFTPNGDGKNDVFRPVLTFTPEDFTLIIRNRWGNNLFETKDPGTGWDGTIGGGRLAPEGIYIYYIRIIADEGEIIEKNGHVSLVFPK
ncbi:MAG: gliding motility-associated C-terminal domain-containing protein [Bacteroidales bacterium]|nr:MAG: gliding motility-associated C-terminal domain-containing protein [Bacteroidales bacterium]